MATKKTKPVAKKTVKAIVGRGVKQSPEPRVEVPKNAQGDKGVGFGSENHAMRTIKWAVDLGLVPKSVLDDAHRADHKSELVSALKRVKEATEIHDYAEQAKRVEEIIQRISRSGD